ncbi:HD domain-containing phosphohydrolase [Thermodesulfovibrio sp. 3907-1M]|uniref:HD domain-containing phosphohydrolase n=1 Tax=Thermodesulfovibrio autotrophicus TaxID=3118333 RepID=A0AAU8GWG8_9BACT
MKIYWVCLQNTYNKRKENLPQGFEIIFISPQGSNNHSEKNRFCVVESERFDDEAIRTAIELKGVLFCENLQINSLNFSLVEHLALSGIPVFWLMSDLVKFLEIIGKNNKNFVNFIVNLFPNSNGDFSHAFKVGELSELIARKLGCDEVSVYCIRTAGILHDVGKFYLPHSFLNSPKRLTDLEKRFVSLHTVHGVNFVKEYLFPLSDTELYRVILDVVQNHHERLDGSGYRKGLTARDISIASKIVSVTDVYSALMCDRPYRTACDKDLALSYIQNKTPQWFDSDVVKVLIEVEKEKKKFKTFSEECYVRQRT